MEPRDIALAQALADVASIAIAQDQRGARRCRTRRATSSTPSTAESVIEQAKGMIAQHGKVTMDQSLQPASRLRA
jgi:hypothetical protein